MARERITVTLPPETARYARQVARRQRKSRSAVIAEALEALRESDLRRQLAEGYRAMAAESRRFAREAMPLAAESWPPDDDLDA